MEKVYNVLFITMYMAAFTLCIGLFAGTIWKIIATVAFVLFITMVFVVTIFDNTSIKKVKGEC